MAGGNLLETVMCLQSSPSWIVYPLSCSSNFPAPKTTVLQLKNPSEKSASKKKKKSFSHVDYFPGPGPHSSCTNISAGTAARKLVVWLCLD